MTSYPRYSDGRGDTPQLLKEWHQQLDDLAPQIARARQRGQRIRIKLYAGYQVAAPRFETITPGRLDRGAPDL